MENKEHIHKLKHCHTAPVDRCECGAEVECPAIYGEDCRGVASYGFQNGGDRFQPTYACRFCENELTMDSQGNWFHLSRLSS